MRAWGAAAAVNGGCGGDCCASSVNTKPATARTPVMPTGIEALREHNGICPESYALSSFLKVPNTSRPAQRTARTLRIFENRPVQSGVDGDATSGDHRPACLSASRSARCEPSRSNVTRSCLHDERILDDAVESSRFNVSLAKAASRKMG